MDQPDSFARWMARLEAGDEAATTEVFRRFVGRLIGLARAQLDDLTLRKEDPEDVVQSVYLSFFRRQEAGEFRLGSWGEVWALLAVITVRKCLNHNKHFRAQRRDAAKEQIGAGREAFLLDGEPDREATPEEAAILRETIEQMMRGLDLQDRAILELSLQGHTVQEIGDRLRIAERTVQRVRGRAKNRLARQIAGELHGA